MGCTNSTPGCTTPTPGDPTETAVDKYSQAVDLNNQAAAEYASTLAQFSNCEEAFHVATEHIGVAFVLCGGISHSEHNNVIVAHGAAHTKYICARNALDVARKNHLRCFRKVTNATALVNRCE